MDDFPADDTTIASHTVFGIPQAAVHESVDDVDWISVSGLKKFFLYDIWLFRSEDDEFTNRADLSIYNQNSELIWDYRFTAQVPGDIEYHHFGASQRHFVAVSAIGSTGGYRLYVRSSDYAGDTFEEADNFAPTNFRQFGSALENNSDVDYLKYLLFEGVEYTVNLLGQASAELGTTLGRMSLRLFDPNGIIVAEDNQFSSPRNASITFTPDETAEYVFEVDSDAATGSYILESEQFDDFRNNSSTTTELLLDGTPISGQSNYGNQSRFSLDQDWFRINPRPGFTYQVESNHANLTLRNESGEILEVETINDSFDNSINRKFQFRNDSGNTLFVSTGKLRTGENEYTLTANVVDDHIATFSGATRFKSNFLSTGTISGAIETEGDRDWIRIDLRTFANYRFTIDADPALAMAVSVRDGSGAIVANGAPNQPLRFSSDASGLGPHYLDVRSNSNQTGTWELRSFAPQGGNDESTQWNVDLSSGAGRIRSIYRNFDNSELWHRFETTPNTWYEIDSQQVSFEVRQGENRPGVAKYQKGKRYYYSGSSTASDRYIVIKQNEQQFGEGGFEINIAKDARIRFRSTGQFSPDPDGFANNTFGFRNVEIYSTVPYNYIDGDDTISVAANSYQTLDTQQWFSIEFNESFTGVGDLYFREVREQGNSQWSSMELYGHHLPAGVSRTPIVLFSGILNFSFADGRPDYLASDDAVVGATQSLTSEEKVAMRNAITQWNRHIRLNLVEQTDPGPNNDASPIMIYKGEIDSDVLAFSLSDDPTGEGLAGDIVLNTNSPLWDNFTKGTKGPFELMRAVGTVLGAPKLESLGRDQSIMGTELEGERADLPYPSTLLPVDITGVREVSVFPHNQTGQLEYLLDEAIPIYETIIHSGFEDGSRVSAATSMLDATIDLRPGQPSFLTDGSSQPATWIMSEYSVVHDAVGGGGNDSLRGNQFDNSLISLAGNDILIGGVGDDYLSGREGDDFYSYRLGHGSDVIDEREGGGTETLRIDGLKDFDGIEDLQFRRFGNSLRITLELGGRDKNADSILIRDMGTQDSAIERLALLQEGNFLHSVSLMSVWEQADQQLRRFDLASGNDDFGRLVSPV